MSPQNHIKWASSLLAGSVAMEIAYLSGFFKASDALYHGIHVSLIALVVLSQLALYLRHKGTAGQASYALLFAIGMAFTGVGDYVNGAMSGVQPVSLKLSWAMLTFGIGYSLYCFALWRHSQSVAKATPGGLSASRYVIALLLILGNVNTWYQHIESLVAVSDVLYYGSFVFNLSIYVALPTLCAWYFINSKWSIGGLIVLLGGALIPYSDLILFHSWLPGNPAVASPQSYAWNWILYFGGQVLVSMFPALVLDSNLNARHQAG